MSDMTDAIHHLDPAHDIVDHSIAPLLPGEARIEANGLEFAYQTFGDPADPPVLMVMGLGTQMIGWPEALLEDLAGRGHYVIRYDNRDIGCSTHLDHLPSPTTADLRRYVARRTKPPYVLDDMATDALRLLDALELPTAHLVGVSMGGFISQHAAIRAPQRFKSLTLLLTSTGSRRVGQPTPKVLVNMARRDGATTIEEAQDAAVATYGEIGSPGFPLDEAYLREKARLSWNRNHDTAGYGRQLAAVVGSVDRTPMLRKLRLPTLVMHGLADPLVRPSGGIAIAKAIPGATFVGYHGMGHDLPRPLWGDMGDQIGRHLARHAERDPAVPWSPS